MRKISRFAAALILIAVGAWASTTTPRVVASTPVGIDPFQMMTNARDLPAAHYVNYSVLGLLFDVSEMG
jgi:hypothetical protein